MDKKPIPPCKVCGKKTQVECAHVECPNRKQQTAGPPPGMSYLSGKVPKRRSNGGTD